MKKSATIGIIFICLFFLTAGNVASEEYGILKGLKSVKSVFDFELGNPQSALVHLNVIQQTFKDKNIWIGKKKPGIVVVFIGPSVKLASKDRGGFSADDQKILDEYAGMISAMAKDGVRFEICLIAAKYAGVDPSSILPEIKQVGNGWISLIGYQAKGYSLVPVSP